MEKKMIRTSFRTTLFRNHRCTKEQNENKGNNIAIKVGLTLLLRAMCWWRAPAAVDLSHRN